jgi:ElaB/YqjD/DUF883 family membrane-anchored ribosome-binding protein
MKPNGGRRPDQILAEIDRTRGELDRTLSAIEQRLTPGQLVDQGLDYLRHSGANEFVQNLGGTAKQNPVPVVLVGIGLAWLMTLGRQPAQPTGSSMSSSGIGERASGAMKSASDSMNAMKDRAGEAAGSVRDRAGQVADASREQWDRAKGGVEYLVNEQPLAIGAIGLAVGAMLGAVAPRTRAEDQLMGEASRNLAQKAKEVGSQQMDKAQQAVKQVAEQATGTEKPKGQAQAQSASTPSASHSQGQNPPRPQGQTQPAPQQFGSTTTPGKTSGR